MAVITDSDVTAFIRSLIEESTAEQWTDAEITLYKKFGMMAVMSKYWYLLMPTEAKVSVTSLVANTAYVELPGREVGTTAFDGSGTNDATFGGTYTHTASLRYVVEIDDATSSPNTFKWSKDGGTSWTATTVNCAITATTLDNGVTIIFLSATGHTLADEWKSDCIIVDCAKVLRVEVAETRDRLRKIESDELFKYSEYDDGGTSASYLNIWYLRFYDAVTDFPVALRPLIAIEAVLYAKTKDSDIDTGILAMQRKFEDAALTFLSTDSPYEPTIFGDYELEQSYTSTNPVAWCFRDNKIYLYKSYDED